MQVLQKYPKFKEVVDSLVKTKLDHLEKETTKHLLIHLDAHKSFMNTRHPHFNKTLISSSSSSPQPERDVKRKTVDTNFSYSGKMTIVAPGTKTAKEADCVLRRHEFSFEIPAKSFMSSEVRERISLENVECHSKSAGLGQRIFVLQRTDNKPVLKDMKNFEMMSSNSSVETEAWVQAFTSLGLFKDVHGSMADILGEEGALTSRSKFYINNSGPTISQSVRKKNKTGFRKLISKVESSKPSRERPSTEAILDDPSTKDQTKTVVKMVENYMSIIDTTVRDVTPKYIVLLLGIENIFIMHF